MRARARTCFIFRGGFRRSEAPISVDQPATGNPSAAPQTPDTKRPIPAWLGQVRFWAIHVLAIGGTAIYGFTVEAVICAVVLYVVRMFFVTAGYHRYFSHRTYKTSRVGQFLLAFGAQTTAQQGALWWAAHHRHHHRHSDQEGDLHSPRLQGFWQSHVGWIFVPQNMGTQVHRVPDLAKFPELLLLDRRWLMPPVLLAVACTALFGLPGLFVGFGLSTLAVWHGTFTINSLSHVFGSQRFETGDDSRNNFLLAMLTLGEGWHNNHHHYQSSVRQGMAWYELDVTYLVLRAAAAVGLVWDLKEPPERVMSAVHGAS